MGVEVEAGVEVGVVVVEIEDPTSQHGNPYGHFETTNIDFVLVLLLIKICSSSFKSIYSNNFTNILH